MVCDGMADSSVLSFFPFSVNLFEKSNRLND